MFPRVGPTFGALNPATVPTVLAVVIVIDVGLVERKLALPITKKQGHLCHGATSVHPTTATANGGDKRPHSNSDGKTNPKQCET